METEPKTPDEKRKSRELTVSSDFVMLAGLLMMFAGWILPEIYWVLGGTLLIFMGVMTLPPSVPNP